MENFAITVTYRNYKRVIKTFDNMKDAKQFGEELASNPPVINCISAEFDNENNKLGDKYKLHNSWI